MSTPLNLNMNVRFDRRGGGVGGGGAAGGLPRGDADKVAEPPRGRRRDGIKIACEVGVVDKVERQRRGVVEVVDGVRPRLGDEDELAGMEHKLVRAADAREPGPARRIRPQHVGLKVAVGGAVEVCVLVRREDAPQLAAVELEHVEARAAAVDVDVRRRARPRDEEVGVGLGAHADAARPLERRRVVDREVARCWQRPGGRAGVRHAQRARARRGARAVEKHRALEVAALVRVEERSDRIDAEGGGADEL